MSQHQGDAKMELQPRVIKALRVLAGLRQVDLAEAVDRTQAWLSYVESGRLIPQRAQANKIAEILRADTEALRHRLGAPR
jgi:transcriptional regulator with XRE-family HTH domain